MPPTTRSSVNKLLKTTRKGHVEERGEFQSRGMTTPAYQEESHYFVKTDQSISPAKVPARGGRANNTKSKRKAPSQDRAEGGGRAASSKRRRVVVSSASASGPYAASAISPPPGTVDGGDEDGDGDGEVGDEDDPHEGKVESETIALPAHRHPESHSSSYHHPLLLTNLAARQALLSWFDSVTFNRAMPWRKPWINPSHHTHKNKPSHLRDLLKKRAYEVWISEVMLQQTRVATVVDYWTRWMARWPTIHDLAAAEHQDVLDAWSGLGYYNRATRVHNAARTICAEDKEYDGLLPDDPAQLEAEMDGVGKYTAGAIAAIVFGKAVPLVDGNVLRVLSRQMGLFGDVQKDRKIVDGIWHAAGRLARQVVRDEIGQDVEEDEDAANFGLPLSDRPGQWGQALMELGSTICTPKPKCSKCPVTSTCRAYIEGYAQAIDAGAAPGRVVPAAAAPKETDNCTLCLGSPIETDLEPGLTPSYDTPIKLSMNKSPTPATSKKTSRFFTTPANLLQTTLKAPTSLGFEIITSHAAKYPPKRTPKKQLPHHESRVIALRRASDGRYLIQRRPATGLLPNMWELPSEDFPALADTGQPHHPSRLPWPSKSTAQLNSVADRGKTACEQIITRSELIIPPRKDSDGRKVHGKNRASGKGIWPFPCMPKMRWVGELGIVPWTFSHLRLTMYVDLFELFDDQPPDMYPKVEIKWKDEVKSQRWASVEEIEGLTMGSGMRRCWDLVKEAEEEGW